jgi:6-pyruvoyl-tetrahydropterin synthase
MKIERAVTVNVEAAHHDDDGRLHGHSYLVECWTTTEQDLPAFERAVREVSSRVDHTVLESSIGGRTMEALGIWFLQWNYGPAGDVRLSRVVVRRPTLGYAVEVRP